MSGNDLVRIRYRRPVANEQDGEFTLTGLMPRNKAESLIKHLDQAEIIESEEYEH